jgi:flagella basal body P-ring formation protein FlgA
MSGRSTPATRPRAVAALAAALVLLAAAAPAADVRMAVLAHAVEKGDRLSAADLTDALTPALAARGGLALADIAGMEASRRLAAGSVVRDADLVRPQLVRRGEQVTLSIRRDGLVITSAARALASAAMGETVRVVTLSTNRTVDAVVEGSAAVRIVNF